HLSNNGIQMIYVSADSLKRDLIRAVSNRTSSETVQAINIWGIDELDSTGIRQLFVQLNFHRDWLGKLNVPLVVWISTELLNQLTAVAPDFWSRRSAVYYFSERTFDDLLNRLFAKARDEGQKWAPEPVLSSAFETILSSEKQLGICLRNKKSFSITSIDNFIRKIRSGVFQLIEECREGRQIEVALWLWNLSNLDAALQEMLDNLHPERRNLFESLYTDRNEVLLSLSEKLIELLQDHLVALEEEIKHKKLVSVVSRVRATAVSKINRMALALASSVEIPLSSEIEEYEAYYSDLLERSRPEPKENTFLAQAAEDLESWLSGHANKCPSFFSTSEAKLLRFLYSDQLKATVIADRLGISPNMARQKVRYLERKVRLYLGLPPRLPSTRRSARRKLTK